MAADAGCSSQQSRAKMNKDQEDDDFGGDDDYFDDVDDHYDDDVVDDLNLVALEVELPER